MMKLLTVVVTCLFFHSVLCADLPHEHRIPEVEDVVDMSIGKLAKVGKDLDVYELNTLMGRLGGLIPTVKISHLLDDNRLIQDYNYGEFRQYAKELELTALHAVLPYQYNEIPDPEDFSSRWWSHGCRERTVENFDEMSDEDLARLGRGLSMEGLNSTMMCVSGDIPAMQLSHLLDDNSLIRNVTYGEACDYAERNQLKALYSTLPFAYGEWPRRPTAVAKAKGWENHERFGLSMN